ncbi:MAG: hypothetical protein IKO07_00605 [Clostridia bacterium]|nr:hypothetical protein [Clostridia bacterium]
MKQQLSIPDWHEMAKNGINMPVRTLIHGGSMFPLIRMDRDYVTIVPVTGSVSAGDIVLFASSGEERYVLHRVWKVRNGAVLTWGDNCRAADGWLPLDAIWGKVTLIERGMKKIHPNPVKGLRLAGIWHFAGVGYRFGRRILAGIRRRLIIVR